MRLFNERDLDGYIAYFPADVEVRTLLDGTQRGHEAIRALVRRVREEMNMRMELDFAGTRRFGTDPATSVLNTDCRAHEVDNLYVVDTSFLPSINAINPALKAMANAVRVGDHLRERMGIEAPGGEAERAG